jgi:hypothetical protein
VRSEKLKLSGQIPESVADDDVLAGTARSAQLVPARRGSGQASGDEDGMVLLSLVTDITPVMVLSTRPFGRQLGGEAVVHAR